jgi:hypothetical protein
MGKPVSINEWGKERKCEDKKELLGKHDRLHAGNLEALAASHILAGHHVIAAEHVGFGFSEAGAVAFVGAAGKLVLLGTHQPVDFVFSGLLAMRTIQRRQLLLRPFIKKLALFHRVVSRSSLVLGQAAVIYSVQLFNSSVLLHVTAGSAMAR